VSNSSSSSFVCEVCGHGEEVHTDEMEHTPDVSCVNGHNICKTHVPDIPLLDALKYVVTNTNAAKALDGFNDKVAAMTDVQSIASFIDGLEFGPKVDRYDYTNSYISSLKQFVQRFVDGYEDDETISLSDLFEMAYDDYELLDDQYNFTYSIPASFCPLCQFTIMSRVDMIKVMAKDMGFGSVDELVNHLTTSRFSNKEELDSYVVDVSI
jgi:hypothetical protein